MRSPEFHKLLVITGKNQIDVAGPEDWERYRAFARRRGWTVTEHGNLDAGQTDGPCQRCGQTCTLYGEHGNPLCPACRGVEPAEPEQPLATVHPLPPPSARGRGRRTARPADETGSGQAHLFGGAL